MRNNKFHGLENLCASRPKLDFSDVGFRDDSELHRLCKLVYAKDEKTLLPSSDLMVLFSDSVPQDIANWVRQNLQSPHELNGVASVRNGQDIDDDTIIELTRGRSESSVQYIERVNDYLRRINKEGSN